MYEIRCSCGFVFKTSDCISAAHVAAQHHKMNNRIHPHDVRVTDNNGQTFNSDIDLLRAG